MLFYILIKLLIGGDNMVVLYVALIVRGRKTFKQVPDQLKEAVKTELEAIDLDENGNPIQ